MNYLEAEDGYKTYSNPILYYMNDTILCGLINNL